MKRLLIKTVLNFKYFLLSFLYVFKKKLKIAVDNPREKLNDYCPKPLDKENIFLNKPINTQIDLSIVIPVYNTEKYLGKCLQSVLEQETKYFIQLICVDDGSPDESYKILEKYQKLFDETPNVKMVIIRQKNRGFSGARNRGIDEANGKYLMFIDSDDYVESNMVEDLLNEAYKKDLDMVIGGWYTFDSESGEKGSFYCPPTNPKKDSPEGFHCYFWGKVYKREFYNDMRLPEGYWFEDMVMNFILHKKCKSYTYIDKSYYAYRQHLNSITNTAPKKIKSLDQYWIFEYVENLYIKHFGELDVHFYNKAIMELGPFLYRRTVGLDDDVRKCVFACASEKIISYNLKTTRFKPTAKRVVKALQNRDFYAWGIASKCYYN